MWAVNEEGKIGDEESTTKGGRGIRLASCPILLFPLLRLKIGGGHVLDVVEDELVGMTKGGRKMIFSMTEAKLYHVEVMRVKTREVRKNEEKKAAEVTSITKVQPEDKGSNEKGADDVVGRMAKLGRAIVPGGKQHNARDEDAETSNNVKVIQPNKEVLEVEEQEVEKRGPTEVPRFKEEEPGLAVDTKIGQREPVERRGSEAEVRGDSGGRREGGTGGGGGGMGGGVTEWSLVMSEVRLQNTELRMSLARVSCLHSWVTGNNFEILNFTFRLGIVWRHCWKDKVVQHKKVSWKFSETPFFFYRWGFCR